MHKNMNTDLNAKESETTKEYFLFIMKGYLMPKISRENNKINIWLETFPTVIYNPNSASLLVFKWVELWSRPIQQEKSYKLTP